MYVKNGIVCVKRDLRRMYYAVKVMLSSFIGRMSGCVEVNGKFFIRLSSCLNAKCTKESVRDAEVFTAYENQNNYFILKCREGRRTINPSCEAALMFSIIMSDPFSVFAKAFFISVVR